MDSRKIARIRQLLKTGAARAIRESACVTLAEVGSDLGVAKSSVCRWELGQRSPRGNVALRYLELLEELSQ